MSWLHWFVTPLDESGGRADAGSGTARREAAVRSPAFAPPVPPSVASGGASGAGGRAPRRLLEAAGPKAAPAEGDTVVLALAADIEIAAGAAVARSRALGGSPVACLWTPDEGDHPYPAGPCLPPVAKAARGLAARGLPATALGGVVKVPLAVDPAEALAQVRRIRAAARGPLIIGLTRRDPMLDVLLEESARILVMGLGDAAMTELVRDRAALVNPAVTVVDRPLSPLGRLGHRLGLTPGAGRDPRSARRPLPDAGAEVLQ